MSQDNASTSDDALKIWEEKLASLERKFAIASNTAEKFELQKEIEEARQHIYRLKKLQREPTAGTITAPQQKKVDNSGIWGLVFLAFVLGIWLGNSCNSSRPEFKIANILQPLQSYQFEADFPENFNTIGNTNNISPAQPGLNSSKCLSLNLSLMPFVVEPPSGQGGFSLTLPNAPQVEAVSTHMLLPQNIDNSPEPIYVLFVADSINNERIYSNLTILKPGYWSPIFWGTRSASWNKPKIQIQKLQLWILRYNVPYTGPVFIDDFVLYGLTQEIQVSPTSTSANN